MDIQSLAIIAGGLLLFSLVSGRLRGTIVTVTVLTVALSALLHGISAAPLASAYARLASDMGECEENMPAAEIPLREGRIIDVT